MLNLINMLKIYYNYFLEKTDNVNLLFNLLLLIKRLECVNNKIRIIPNLDYLELKEGNHINIYSMRGRLGNIVRKINLERGGFLRKMRKPATCQDFSFKKCDFLKVTCIGFLVF